MIYVVTYLATLIAFVAMDAIWLTSTNATLYRPALGDILLPGMNAPPAIAFYLIYPIGLIVFAIAPALRGESVLPVILYGALFGALAYTTYDLTNYATLRNWTLQITLMDIVWGAFASATASSIAYAVATRIYGSQPLH